MTKEGLNECHIISFIYQKSFSFLYNENNLKIGQDFLDIKYIIYLSCIRTAINETERQLDMAQENFEKISRTIKKVNIPCET